MALPLPKDDVALFVRAQGYALSYIEDAQDVLDEQQGRIVLRLAFTLRGVTTDEAGVPLVGVRASIQERTHPPRATTEDGRFTFEGLELREYYVNLEREGYGFSGAAVWPDDREHTFALYRLVPLSGVVLFPDGTPAPGVSVRAIHPVTTTDEDGRFHFAQVTPRGLPLIAWRDQYLGYGDNAGSFYRYWGRAHFKVERGREPEDVTIQLKERGLSYMRARVFDVNGAPLAKVSVNVTSTHGMGYSSTYTDTEGRVTVACPVFPGAEVLVNVPWSKQDRRTALRTRVRTAATHREDEVALRLPPPIMFTVIARGAAGEPLPAGTHAGIQLWMGNHWVEHSAHDRVTFACEAGLAGPYGLKITAPGYLEFSKWPWKPPEPGGTAEIRLRPAGSITGTLRHASGDAVEDVGIVAVPQEGRRRIYGELRKDGNFIIRGVDAGTYSLWVVHRHQATERIGAAEVAPGGVSDVGILRATATRPLKIVVTDHAGSRVTGARVSLFTGPGKLEEQSEVAVTGRDGTARIEVVPGAEAAVLIVKRG
ncbi:MAG: hypothetical protein ACE10D_12990, partial [Planctomycetota bacterium]